MGDCGKHSGCECGYGCGCGKWYRWLLAICLVLSLLVLIAILVVWLVLRPTRPKFFLQNASVSHFTVSGADLLSVTIEVTVSSRNPNDGDGIYYDRLDVYASYKNQQITAPTAIPPFYQGHHDVNVWSPYLSGFAVPLAPYLMAALRQDQAAGFLLLDVKLDGSIRWKAAIWNSGHYHLFVTCPVALSFHAGYAPVVNFQQFSECSVDV